LEVNAESLHRLHGDLSSAATIALTTSAYADDMRPREEDIGQIPQGVVSQNRRLFGGNSSIQSTTPLGSSASSPCTVPRSAFELLLESKRRASREADDELKNKVQRTSSVARETLFGSSSGFDEVPVTRTSSFNIGRTDAPRRESLETEMCDREKVETKRDGRTVVRMDGREYEKQKMYSIC
uniref:Kinesin motor domain-containing protein n=1 Tax=Toxocara canis TaxID=6265 RepID=A0A183USP3_TOXCA